MKQRLNRFLATVAVVSTTLTIGCTKLDGPTVEVPKPMAQVLTVSTPESASTRLNFTDSSEGIDVSWRNDPAGLETDRISIFDSESGDWVTNFIYRGSDGSSSGLFERIESSGSDLTAGNYTAVYPMVDASITNISQRDLTVAALNQVQNSAISTLNNSCYMIADFTYSVARGGTILFENQMSIMAITFSLSSSTSKPTSLIFTDGDDADRVYSVNYASDIVGTGGFGSQYTTYIMIHPNESGALRELRFVITESGSESDIIYSVLSSIPYVAGYKYNAPLSELTPQETFEIYTVEDLQEFKNLINRGNAVVRATNASLMANLDLSDYSNFGTIGFSGLPYLGTFDGNGYSITNFTASSTIGTGLFAGLGDSGVKGAEIKDLTLINPTITGQQYCGAIVGFMEESSLTNCTVVGGTITSGNNYVGGLVGQSYNATITNCHNSATVTSSGSYIGGLIGQADGSTITNSLNSVEVSGSGESSNSIGGLVGRLVTSEISYSYSTGDVSGYDIVGGIIGSGSGNSTLSYVYSTGTATASTATLGAIAAELTSTSEVIDSYYVSASSYGVDVDGVNWLSSISALNGVVGIAGGLPSPPYSAGADTNINPPTLMDETILIN